ncbi:hypothetical protein BJY24_005873 [Nocardia transvalensis]|uniref:LppP/LprE lipoprotein n=1 Tax=Nocardia transvalensis TaxID=37333 RepID=A0A7W9PIU1_9NOCA|nr:LppP/LprE family lipoprotein [Nocardia transvalensis]MBB5916961.1 hypothetical protein [Nocardia transvalensis]
MSRTIATAVATTALACALAACGSSTGPSAGSDESKAPAATRSPSAAAEQATHSSTVSPARCGVDLGAPAVRQAASALPPEASTHAAWNTDPATFEGNFDPCATLSTAIVSIAGATGSSPQHALMFHRGEYLGTATADARGFTTLAAAATTDDTVVLDYKTPGSCNACPDATHTQVGFHWDGTRVVMEGNPPK